MTEYKLIFHWGNSHWTAITFQYSMEGIVKYINANLPEMEEAMEEDENNSFSVEKRVDDMVVSTWVGTPRELLDCFE